MLSHPLISVVASWIRLRVMLPLGAEGGSKRQLIDILVTITSIQINEFIFFCWKQ